jgi:hypothetical protein
VCTKIPGAISSRVKESGALRARKGIPRNRSAARQA